MRQFSDFWDLVHRGLEFPVSIARWSRDGRTVGQKSFSAWSGRGVAALRIAEKNGTRLRKDALYCETLDQANMRVLSEVEAKKVYGMWVEYQEGSIKRSEFRHVSQNLTYLLSIFHHFQKLMEG